MAKNNQVKIAQDPEKEIATEVLAKSIVEIAAGMKKLTASPLERDTIVHLVAWKSRVPKEETAKVIDTLEDLEALLLKPKGEKKRR